MPHTYSHITVARKIIIDLQHVGDRPKPQRAAGGQRRLVHHVIVAVTVHDGADFLVPYAQPEENGGLFINIEEKKKEKRKNQRKDKEKE